MNQTLSWGLVIATYQREKILPQCLELAVNQTRKPSEVVIVDASDYWEQTRDRVMADIASHHPDIRWVYVAAHQQGLPLQRNQGLSLATAEIVFLIDDDSLMYSTCAEEIMKVYEADTEKVVTGVQAALVDDPPSGMTVNDEAKPVGWKENQWLPWITSFQRFIWKHLFLMHNEVLFIPYYGTFPSYQIPQKLLDLDAHFIRLFHGCRMTFRREVITQEQFEPLLLFYALAEDLDASYRVSKHGPLIEASRAKLHHFQSNSGRASRYVVMAMSVLNQAVCLRRYSNDLKRDRTRFYILTLRRVIAEVFKDALSRRWSFPQVRGILIGLRYAPTAFKLSEAELTNWYPQFQKEFIASGKSTATNKSASEEIKLSV